MSPSFAVPGECPRRERLRPSPTAVLAAPSLYPPLAALRLASVDFESTTSTIPSHRQVCYLLYRSSAKAVILNMVAAFQAAECRHRLRCPVNVLGANAFVPHRPRYLLRLRFTRHWRRSGSHRWILSPLRLPFHHTGRCFHSIQHLFKNSK